MSDSEFGNETGGRPNKTQQKREISARTALVERMTGLSDRQLASLGLDGAAVAEIARVRAIRPSGGRASGSSSSVSDSCRVPTCPRSSCTWTTSNHSRWRSTRPSIILSAGGTV